MILGALFAYVVGGVVGRLISREEHLALDRFARVPPGELFAGTLTAIAGLLLAAALCVPLLALVHRPSSTAGDRRRLGGRHARLSVGAAKGRQVVTAAGLSRILAPPIEPPRATPFWSMSQR